MTQKEHATIIISFLLTSAAPHPTPEDGGVAAAIGARAEAERKVFGWFRCRAIAAPEQQWQSAMQSESVNRSPDQSICLSEYPERIGRGGLVATTLPLWSSKGLRPQRDRGRPIVRT